MKSKKSEDDKARKLNDVFDGRKAPTLVDSISTKLRYRADGWEDWLDPLHEDEREDGTDVEMGTPSQDAVISASPVNRESNAKDPTPTRHEDAQVTEIDILTSKRQHLDVEATHSKRRRGRLSHE